MASENENEKRDTVADIVATVRRAAQYYEGEAEKSEGLLRESFKLSAANYREIANLVEAAAKRDEARAVEHATRHAEAVARDNCRDCVHNPKGKNYEGGNAAAMREALREAIGETCAGCKRDCDDCMNLKSGWMKKAKVALSAPARNCDVFNCVESARQAWLDDADNWNDFGSPKLELHEWLYAPAKRKGEDDGR